MGGSNPCLLGYGYGPNKASCAPGYGYCGGCTESLCYLLDGRHSMTCGLGGDWSLKLISCGADGEKNDLGVGVPHRDGDACCTRDVRCLSLDLRSRR